jgi:hypothetical protein
MGGVWPKHESSYNSSQFAAWLIGFLLKLVMGFNPSIRCVNLIIDPHLLPCHWIHMLKISFKAWKIHSTFFASITTDPCTIQMPTWDYKTWQTFHLSLWFPTTLFLPPTSLTLWEHDQISLNELISYLQRKSKIGGRSKLPCKGGYQCSNFIPGNLAGFTVCQANKTLDKVTAGIKDPNTTPFSSNNWCKISVDIEVPVPVKNAPPKKFTVPGLHSRSIIGIIKVTWGLASLSGFH